MRTVAELRQWGRSELAERVESNSQRPGAVALEVDVLLGHVLGWSQAEILSRLQDPVGDNTHLSFAEMVRRRRQSEPIAYITGKKEFYGLDFQVGSDVLIPRPETELVVEQALRIAKLPLRPLQVIDVGTGSGAILVSFLVSLREQLGEESLLNITAYAVDLSEKALSVAKKNAERHDVFRSITFQQSDLLSSLPPYSGVEELILANPPYVGEHEELPPDVRDFEPLGALFAGPDGLDVIFRLLEQVSHRFQGKKGTFIMEIGHRQRLAVEFALNSIPDVSEIEFFEDLQGISRVVVAKWGAVSA